MENMKKHYKRVLTVAGSDPSGGAGIQADLKTFAACGCYGASAIVAVVDENTQGVTGIHEIPVDFVTGQIRSVLDDIGADAIKIGMLHSSELILAVKHTLMRYNIRNMVLDPVMVASSGDRLLRDEAVETLRNELIPSVRVITPNIPEAEVLLGCRISSRKDMVEVVRDLSADRRVSVLLKAGHLKEEHSADVFYNAETDEIIELKFQRVNTDNTHGTGCTLSSAIAAYLALGLSLEWSVRRAKDYVNMAITFGAHYNIGKGKGPVHHFYRIWQ
jgi:hydroxymethylpyrimidine/phosphomethylpyrimidine kinase